jgi:hypothetical protein
MYTERIALMRPFLLVLLLTGCGAASTIASGIRTANTVGRGLAPVLGWCEENGGAVDRIRGAADAIQRNDLGQALDLTSSVVRDLKRLGVPVPEDKAALLQLATELYAAQAIEQAARALAGRKPDGSP